jgi:hypothetical protein
MKLPAISLCFYVLMLVVGMTFSSNIAFAVEPTKYYYVGEVKLSSGDGKSLGSQVILFEKTHDPGQSRMVEAAVVIHPDGKVEEHVMRASVSGNTFTLRDDAGNVEGAGTLSGPAWQWTYFKAKYKSKNGVEIEDENFMADDSAITARKKVSGPDGRVFMHMDMTLKAITPKTHEILRAGLTKKQTQTEK